MAAEDMPADDGDGAAAPGDRGAPGTAAAAATGRPPGLRRRRPRWRRRLVGCGCLVLFGPPLAFLALEAGARLWLESPFGAEGELVGMYQNAEHWGGVRTVPGWTGEHTVEGRTVPVRLDSLGLRGPEPGERVPGELRVLCTGDSFVFGYGVTAEEAFPAVLGELLATRLGRPVVAGNAGVPGYGTVEQARTLNRLVPEFEPDVVVATLYLGNDFLDDQYDVKFVEGGYSINGDWALLMRRSARARLMLRSHAWLWIEMTLSEAGFPWALNPRTHDRQRRAFRGWPKRKAPNQTVGGLFMDVIDDQRAWIPPGGPPVVPRVLARTRESLTAIRKNAGRAQVILMVLPTWFHLVPEDRLAVMKKARLDPAEYRPGLAQERLAALCAELDLPMLDITAPASRLDDPRGLYLPADRHLNPAGHRFVAEQLADAVSAQLD